MSKLSTRVAVFAVGVVATASALVAQQRGAPPATVAIDVDDIGGVVRSAGGTEAGVWVIAETRDLPTKFWKIVVTDDQGRYVLPDLPKANYSVWVRGYGLVDSAKVQGAPGRELNLTAIPAPDAKAAAQYYPPNYWLSLLQIPPKSAFPVGDHKNQPEWISAVKQCNTCHALGARSMREPNPLLGKFATTADMWDRRVRSGQNGTRMDGQLRGFGRQRGIAMFADWTDRILAGELPPVPPRPQGRERDVVVSLWEASTATPFMHDVSSTDKRNPTVNAGGPVYGIDFHHGTLVILDPNKATASSVEIPTLVDKREMPTFTDTKAEAPSTYWGEDVLYEDHVQPNNVILDQKGRVWMSAAVWRNDNQAWCSDGSNKYSKLFPLKVATRHVAMYDPATKKMTPIFTCFRTHHVRFGRDKDNTAYFNGLVGATIGWINTRVYDETGDSQKAQGWCTAYSDINGDGKIDPRVDRPIQAGLYSVEQSPIDGSLWGASPGTPGRIVRMALGSNPPETCVSEVYEPPFNLNPTAPGQLGYNPRGIDIDSNGVVWTALATSGHMASFDRRKCKVLTGEAATTGKHCPEGWTLYRAPGPQFKGLTDDGMVDFFYYNWVDVHNTFGLGTNIPVAAASASDALYALNPTTKEWTTLRVPYPLNGLNARGLDGRIDNPNTGWKGRGLWTVNGTRASWLSETGKGTRAAIAHFQLRPNPLAK